MSKTLPNALSVSQPGTSKTLATATSELTAIPNDSQGNLPKYVRVTVTTAGAVHVRPVVNAGSPTATINDLPVIGAAAGTILTVGRNTHIASYTAGASMVMVLTPLDDQ